MIIKRPMKLYKFYLQQLISKKDYKMTMKLYNFCSQNKIIKYLSDHNFVF